MPELADVEGFRRVFNDNARGFVRAVHVNDVQVVRRTTARALSDTLRGRRFGAARRHGKWLIAPLAGRRSATAVLLHFGMTGELVWADQDEEQHRHDRVVFEFDHGQLRLPRHAHTGRLVSAVEMSVARRFEEARNLISTRKR